VREAGGGGGKDAVESKWPSAIRSLVVASETPEVPQLSSDMEQQLRDDLQHLRGQAMINAEAYRDWRGRYEFVTWLLGIPAATLAGAAAVTALKDVSPTLVAILAGLAGALSSIQLALRPADRATFNHSQQLECETVALEVDTLLKYKLTTLAAPEAVAELERLRKKLIDIRRRSPGSS
jgi:hypothetical protein